MFKRLSIILIPLIFIFGCRNTKNVTSETHFFDTTKVILIDTLNYKDDGVKIVLTPKNDVIFESSDELFETITSQNYSVKEIEVNRSVLEGFNRMEEQTTTSVEKASQIEEKKHQEKNIEHTSLRVLFFFMILVVFILFVTIIYEKIRFNNIRILAKEFEKYDVNKWTY